MPVYPSHASVSFIFFVLTTLAFLLHVCGLLAPRNVPPQTACCDLLTYIVVTHLFGEKGMQHTSCDDQHWIEQFGEPGLDGIIPQFGAHGEAGRDGTTRTHQGLRSSCEARGRPRQLGGDYRQNTLEDTQFPALSLCARWLAR